MEYKIYIIKENGKASAELRDNARGSKKEFNISNVIGDFIGIRSAKINSEGQRKIFYNLAAHVFSGTFDTPLGEQEEYFIESKYEDVKSSFKFLKKAKSIINDPSLTFLKKQLAFQEILNISNSSMSVRITLRDYEDDGVLGYNTPSSNYSQLRTQDSWFDYNCCSVVDMVASVMHYYIMNNYKLVRCRHCDRFYATANLKQEYCQRLSPYQNEISQKESKQEICEITVRRELQHLRDKKNKLLKRIGESPQGQTLKKNYYLTFSDRCAEWMKTAKQFPTPENFNGFYSFLNQIEQKKEWKR